MRKNSPKQKGLVLIVTLVLLTAISTIAGLLYMEATKYRKLNRILERLFLEEMLAPQALERVLKLIALYQKEYEKVPREGRLSYRAGLRLGAGKIEFHFLAEDELINLNQATPEEVQKLLEELGVAPERALSLAEALADWIDADDDPRPAGAERDDGEGYFPRNKPLQDFAELLLVKGFDPYLLYGLGLVEQASLWSSSSKESTRTETVFSLKPGKIYRLFLSWQNDWRKRRLMVVFRFASPPQIIFWTFLP